MIRDVHLYGVAGQRFGRHFRLDIASPAEAVRALCTLRPGFRETIREGRWRVIVGRPVIGNSIPLAQVHMRLGAQALHIVPVTAPHGGGGLFDIGEIVVGTLLIGASIFFPAIAPIAVPFGIGLVAGGIGGLLTPTPQLQPGQQPTDVQAAPGDRPSFFFQGVTNNSVQGGPVPLVFGTHLTGSVVVSASINNQDIG